MSAAPLPTSEESRIATLRSYQVLDTPADDGFSDIVDAARSFLAVPIAMVVLVDSNRQWFKAHRGVNYSQTDRDVAFCAHTILENEPMIVPDTFEDDRFRDNPLVTSDPKVRFYIGVPLLMPNGEAIGTICALDIVPRLPRQNEVKIMRFLARQTVRLLELHKVSVESAQLQPDQLNGQLSRPGPLIERMRPPKRTSLRAHLDPRA